jgi:hypothetical protein
MVAVARERGLNSQELLAEVKEAIQNPTDRMRKSFRALPVCHKWALVSLLEAGDTYVRSAERVGKLYESHCPVSDCRPFGELVQELSEAFVKIVPSEHGAPMIVDWMHPSYRDLVIDELATDASLQADFLRSMSLEGIKLAVSSSGGSTGNRQFPLMTSPLSWERLEKGCMTIAFQEVPWTIAQLLETLTEAVHQAEDSASKGNLLGVIAKACEGASARWDEEGAVLDHKELSRFSCASELVCPLPKLPDLTASWVHVMQTFKRVLQGSKKGGCVYDPDSLEECVEFWNVVKENEPRLLRREAFPENFETEFEELLELMEEDAKSEPILDTPDEYRAESWRLVSLRDAIGTLLGLTIKHHGRCEALVTELSTLSARYDRRADELEPEEPEYEDESRGSPLGDFSIDALFSDL